MLAKVSVVDNNEGQRAYWKGIKKPLTTCQGFWEIWSGKRGSNSRPQPWQGCALPTELFPHCVQHLFDVDYKKEY